MKKNLICAALALVTMGVAGLSFAVDTVTEEASSARWTVLAAKDSAAALTIQPVGGPVKFKYDPFTASFTPQSATYQVSVKGDTAADLGFKLEAQLGATHSIKSNDSSSKAGANIALTADGVALDGATWVSLVDSSAGTAVAGLDGVRGEQAGVTGGVATFQAALEKFTIADGTSAVAVADLPDGAYTGSVDANFRATWTASGPSKP